MKQKITALLLAAMLILAICPTALAEGENVTISVSDVIANLGETAVSIQATVTNNSEEEVIITSVKEDSSSLFKSITVPSSTIKIENGKSVSLTFPAELNPNKEGIYNGKLVFAYNVGAESKTQTIDFTLRIVNVSTAQDVTISVGEVVVNPGETVVSIQVTVVNKSGGEVKITSVKEDNNSNIFKSITIPKGAEKIKNGESVSLMFPAELNAYRVRNYSANLVFKYTIDGSAQQESIQIIRFTLPEANASAATPDPSKPAAAFRLSSYDPNGLIVPTAAGKNGGKVQVRLPLLCVDGPVSNIKAVPKLSTSLDEFPFAIEQVDYTIGYNGMIGVNQIIEFQFNLRFADKVTAGVKKVDFTITYDRGWASATGDSSESCDISLYVNVTRGYEAAGSEPGGETTAALPKIVVDSYSFSSDKIYAGEDFDLTFTVRNTSNEEETKSILVTVTNNAETGKLTPASGSNTLYIDKLGKGESKTMTMSIATAPDTEAKAYEIKLEFDYEGTKTRPATLSNGQSSASIPVTIMQKIRLKIEDPTIDGEPMEGESVPVYFSMYNMGRSSIYNCMVTVEGDGLSMEESFFQGTVAAGSTMRADFSLITATPGQIDGEIVITYEDSLEEKMEERLPLSLYVSEAYNPDMYPGEGDPNGMIDTMGGMEDPSASGGIPVWAWIVGGVVAAAAVVAVIIILKKKRARALEDV